MNYYEHHLGDYAKDAGHLSMIEEGAYRRLLDAYYIREKPLPADLRDCCKLARATTKAERDAVAYVLGEFFKCQNDGYHQTRADEEIDKYLDAEPDREQRREHDRERQRRARERRRELFEQLRSHGIVPPYNTKTGELEAQLSRVTAGGQSQVPVTPVTCDNTATSPQSPVPSPQSQQEKPPSGVTRGRATHPEKPEGVGETVWTDWLALRRAKKAPVTETVLADARRESAKAGMPLEAFLAEWCSRGSQGLKAEWLANGSHQAKPINRQLAIEAENRRVLAEALGKGEDR